jgi:hypothetical protein
MSIASHADWGDRANPEGSYSWDQGLIEKEMAVEEFAIRAGHLQRIRWLYR